MTLRQIQKLTQHIPHKTVIPTIGGTNTLASNAGSRALLCYATLNCAGCTCTFGAPLPRHEFVEEVIFMRLRLRSSSSI